LFSQLYDADPCVVISVPADEPLLPPDPEHLWLGNLDRFPDNPKLHRHHFSRFMFFLMQGFFDSMAAFFSAHRQGNTVLRSNPVLTFSERNLLCSTPDLRHLRSLPACFFAHKGARAAPPLDDFGSSRPVTVAMSTSHLSGVWRVFQGERSVEDYYFPPPQLLFIHSSVFTCSR